MAGRNAQKLEVARNELRQFDPNIAQVPILTAQLENKNSLDEITKQADVVITTVGPYSRYGTPMVDSAIRNKSHVLDLNGEINWIRSLIDEYHHQAQENGVKIINTSGYEVVPTDLGAYMVADYAQKNFGNYCDEIFVNLQEAFGGVSGGTASSAVEVRSAMKAPDSLKYQSIFCLTPDTSKRNDDFEYKSFKYEPSINSWVVGSPS